MGNDRKLATYKNRQLGKKEELVSPKTCISQLVAVNCALSTQSWPEIQREFFPGKGRGGSGEWRSLKVPISLGVWSVHYRLQATGFISEH